MTDDPVATPSLEALLAEVWRLRALVAEQATAIAHQRQRTAALDARLATDGHHLFKALVLTLQGSPPMPRLAPESFRSVSPPHPAYYPHHRKEVWRRHSIIVPASL